MIVPFPGQPERTCPTPPKELVDRAIKRQRRAVVSRERMKARGIPSLRLEARRQEAKQQHPTHS